MTRWRIAFGKSVCWWLRVTVCRWKGHAWFDPTTLVVARLMGHEDTCRRCGAVKAVAGDRKDES